MSEAQHCPGVTMTLSFFHLFPGSMYTLRLVEGAVFTGASAAGAWPPGSVKINPTEVTLTAPSVNTPDQLLPLQLGVAIRGNEILGFTSLTSVSHVIIGLLGFEVGSEGGNFQLSGWPALPPTCVMTNEKALDCPVCAGDGSKCLQSPGAGSQFYLDMHQMVNCVECPDECTPIGKG